MKFVIINKGKGLISSILASNLLRIDSGDNPINPGSQNFQDVTTGDGNNITTNPVIYKKNDNEFIVVNSADGFIEYWDKNINPDTSIARYGLNGNFYISNPGTTTWFQYEDGFLYLKDNNGFRYVFSSGEMVISSEDDTIISRYGNSQFQLLSLDTDTFRHEILTGNPSGLEVSKRPATPILAAKESIKTTFNSIIRTFWNYEFEVNVINEFFLPDLADGWNGKLATEEHVTNAVLQLLNGAPSDGNTLKELNDKILAINAIIGGTTADGDSLVNTVAELLAVFSTYPEGTDIATILAGKLNKTDVIESLTQIVAGKALDATQGKVLYDLIGALTSVVAGKQNALGFTPDKPLSYMSLNNDYVGTGSTTLQKAFNVGSGGNGSYPVLANKKYKMTMFLYLEGLSSTSGTVSVGILGTATIDTFFGPSSAKRSGSPISPAAGQMALINVSPQAVVTATTNSAGYMFVEIDFTTLSAGFVIPAFAVQISTTPVVKKGSFASFKELGANTLTSTSDIQ